MVKEMKKIAEWLKENNIEHEEIACGNPYYFDDGFSVPAIRVSFDYSLCESEADIAALQNAEQRFLQKAKRIKSITFQKSMGCWGRSVYVIYKAGDFSRLVEHENRVQEAVKQFWENRHRAYCYELKRH